MEDEDALGVSIESGTAVAASGTLSGSAGDTELVPSAHLGRLVSEDGTDGASSKNGSTLVEDPTPLDQLVLWTTKQVSASTKGD